MQHDRTDLPRTSRGVAATMAPRTRRSTARRHAVAPRVGAPSTRSGRIGGVAPPSPENPDELAAAAATAKGAEKAWAAVQRTGGVITIRGMAERWGITIQTARAHAAHSTFPKPIEHVDRADLWLTAAVDHWRATPRSPGRPPKDRTTPT
jgi:predicted DNA-binding transcriptional regulator AlpA